MKTLKILAHAIESKDIQVEWHEQAMPVLAADQCLIKVACSAINASDALAAIGYFSHATLPRTPGRDFSGTVVDGPAQLVGKKVWGTGGAAGISFDGTQAEYIRLHADDISEIPTNMDLMTAGAQTLPYVTAYYALVKRARIQAGETVLIAGALGQVGKAAMSICQWKKCHPIALVRGKADVARAQQLGWQAIDSEDPLLAEHILALNNQQPVNVILNSLGNIFFQQFNAVLADFGRIVTIGAREGMRDAVVNLFEQYRKNQEIIGINTISFDYAQNKQWLDELRVGFESEQLIPLDVFDKVYSPLEATEVYQQVLKGALDERLIIQFNPL